MGRIIAIKYCLPCQYEKLATDLAEEFKIQFGERVSKVLLEPTQSIGSFEVSLDDELVFSKKAIGRLPQPGEVGQIIMTRIYK